MEVPEPSHTQASDADPWPLSREVPRVSRPPRKLLEFSFFDREAGSGGRPFSVRVFLTRRRFLYMIVKPADRDAGGPFPFHVS